MKTRQTSIDCYNQIKANGLLSKRRLEVYEAILKNAPCTSSEAMAGNLNGTNVLSQSRARFTELRKLGVIYERGYRKCKITGRNVIEWDLTDKVPRNIKLSSKATKKQRVNNALEAFDELYNRVDDDSVSSDDWKNVYDLINNI